jgi:hypothetical protein
MKLHVGVLGKRQVRLLPRLGPVLKQRGFYLAGGTALALLLGHRRSVDLDWFTSEHLDHPLRLADLLRDAGFIFQVEDVAPGTLHGAISGVRVSFLDYRYPLLRPLVDVRRLACTVASLRDLAAMKLSAIAQRGAKKDFIDLHALLAKRIRLPDMLAWYQRKHSISDLAHVLVSLTYFDDADRERAPRMYSRIDWRAIKSVIRDDVQRLAR